MQTVIGTIVCEFGLSQFLKKMKIVSNISRAESHFVAYFLFCFDQNYVNAPSNFGYKNKP